jgi:hypothetical protein
MSENNATKPKWEFLTTWSILNLVGWLVGICFMFFPPSFEYNYKFSAVRASLGWLPLRASLGLFQWVWLKRLRVNFFLWVFVTSVGVSTFFTLYSWVLNFDSFNYREYNIPPWLINSGLAMATLIGGAIVGSFQSIIVRKHISSLGPWIGGYAFAPFLAFAIGTLAFSIKSVLLETLYFLGWYDIALGPGKFILLYVLMVLVTSVTISLFTGKALLKQVSLEEISRTG